MHVNRSGIEVVENGVNTETGQHGCGGVNGLFACSMPLKLYLSSHGSYSAPLTMSSPLIFYLE